MNETEKNNNFFFYFFRFNPTIDDKIQLDEIDDLKLIDMMFKTKVYMHLNKSKVTEMLKCLK